MNYSKNKSTIVIGLVFCFFAYFSGEAFISELLRELSVYGKVVNYELVIGMGAVFFFFFLGIVAIIFANKAPHIERLDESDFEKNKDYYRDIVNNYSISELNYIDKFKLDYSQAFTAKLLELQNKKVIELSNNTISILKEPNTDLDRRFVNSIKNNKITMSLKEYEDLIIRDAIHDELIESTSGKSTFLKIAYWLVGISSFGMILLGLIINGIIIKNLDSNVKPYMFGIIGLSIFFVFGLFFIIIYHDKSRYVDSFKRTRKGQEINRKLDGLKLFLKDFSNIDSKQSEHLVLWDDYLIYSVMFNINKKIQEEYSRYW